MPIRPLSVGHCTLAAQPPQLAQLSQHQRGQGEAPTCHSTALSPGFWSLKALYAVLQSLHVYFFKTSVNPPGIQVPDRIFTFLHLSSCSQEYMHSHIKLQIEWSCLMFMQDRTSYLSDDISHFAFYRTFSTLFLIMTILF